MKLNDTSSNLLRFESFVAACCVVMIHANTIHVVAQPAAWNEAMHAFICQTLTSWAVPYFFAASGFFFALSSFDWSWGGYWRFLQKKVRGLLVPYILWSLVAILIATPLVFANNCMTGRPIVERSVFDATSFLDFVDSVFGIMRDSPKQLGVLWFVRSLMILFVFAPLWRLLTHRALAWILFALWIVCWLFLPSINTCGFRLSFSSLSFFFLGMTVAVYTPRHWLERTSASAQWSLPHVMHYSFWIYCTHNIILGYMLAAGHFIMGKSNVAIAILTPLAIALTIAVSLWTAKFMEVRFPKIFCLLNGGRV